MRRLLIALVLGSLAALSLPATGAHALQVPVFVQLVNPFAPLTFEVEMANITCEAGSIQIDEVFDDNNDPVTPLSVTPNPSDPNRATFVLPDDTVAGELSVTASCVDDVRQSGVGVEEWGNLAVTKVVEGAVPEATTFVVNADCEGTILELSYGEVGASEVPENFVVDLTFPASGGVGHVYTDHSTTCALTEPQNGGAISTTIDPELVTDLENPGSTSATVTNVFPAALPLVIQPTFTG